MPTSFQLPNGLTVLVNERPGLPLVSANLVVRTGSGANPVDKPGLANFTAAMLDEGTGVAIGAADRRRSRPARRVTHAPASTMDAIAGVGELAASGRFPQLLELMADVARHPAFPAEEIDRQRASRLASLVQQRENPNAVAAAVMAAALYGPAHPYGYTELGTEASNKAMTPGRHAEVLEPELRAEQRRAGRLGPDHGRASCGRWSKRRSATGRARRRSQPSLGEPTTTAARLVIVDKPGAPQTQIRVAADRRAAQRRPTTRRSRS